MSRTPIETPHAPAAIGPYSQAIKTGNLLFISGQIPLDPESMEMVSDDFTEQARQVFRNLEAVCEAAGTQLQSAVKLTVYLTDLGQFAAVNDVMASVLTEPWPARAAIEVSALPRNAQVEIDAIIALDD